MTRKEFTFYVDEKYAFKPSHCSNKRLARTFRHAAWLNPQPEASWEYTWTIGVIRKIFPMFELTLDGLEKAVKHLMKRY